MSYPMPTFRSAYPNHTLSPRATAHDGLRRARAMSEERSHSRSRSRSRDGRRERDRDRNNVGDAAMDTDNVASNGGGGNGGNGGGRGSRGGHGGGRGSRGGHGSDRKRDDMDEIKISATLRRLSSGAAAPPSARSRVCECDLDLDEKDGTIKIFGPAPNRKRAIDYINFVSNQRLKTGVHVDLSTARDDLTVVDVPADCVGFVMGKGGNTLRQMEEEWGTLMFFAQVGQVSDGAAGSAQPGTARSEGMKSCACLGTSDRGAAQRSK